MKLYDADWAPNPRRVRIFLAEKGIQVERIAVDLRRDEQLGAEYLAVNARGTVPALRLDNGEVIADSIAICRFFDALHPAPALFGVRPLEIARIEEWTRRIESDGYAAAVYALRNRASAFAGRALAGKWPPVPQVPALLERGQVMWGSFIAALDMRLGDSEWIAGDYSVADISALVTIDFAKVGKLAVPEEATHVRRWYEAVSARPSASA